MILIHILSWCLLLTGVVPNKMSPGADKPWLAVHLIDTSLQKNAYSVVRMESSRYILESPQRYTHLGERTITILRDGSHEDVVHLSYNKYCDAEIIEANLYDALGRLIRKVKKNEFQDQLNASVSELYSDQRVLFARLSGGQYPYTIEYKYALRYKETMAFAPWMPARFNQSVEKAVFSIESPRELKVHAEDRQSSFQHTQTDAGQMVVHNWTLENWKSMAKEDHGPSFFEVLPILLLSPASFQVETYKGSMNDWSSFGQFLYEINTGRERLSPEMAAEVQNMVRNIDDTQKRIDTLYSWMQQHTRYVSIQLGIGGWQSFDARYVEKNKFGDCKALSTFMKGMLQEIGIESWPVVVDWSDEPTLMARHFASSYFNHMMLHIPSQDMWLECTSNYLPTGMIDKGTQDKPVLLITPQGGVLSKTPRQPENENIIHTLDTLVYHDGWQMSGRTLYHGNTQGRIRAVSHYTSVSELRELFLDQFHLPVDKLHTLHANADEEGKQARMTYSMQLHHYGSTSGNRFFVPLYAYNSGQIPCESGHTRETPYVSNEDYTRIHDVWIRVPEGYNMEYMPESKTIDHALVRYHIEVSLENALIHIHRSMTFRPGQLDPEAYPSLCRFFDDVRKADGMKIVWVSKA